MAEEIIGRLPELSGTQLGRLEDEIRRERQRLGKTSDRRVRWSPSVQSPWGDRMLPKPGYAPRTGSVRLGCFPLGIRLASYRCKTVAKARVHSIPDRTAARLVQASTQRAILNLTPRKLPANNVSLSLVVWAR